MIKIKSMLRRYGLYGFLKLSQYYILTKLSFKNSRLIRFPIDVRNKKFIDFGYGLTTGRYCRIECFPDKFEVKKKCICFGNNVEINDFVHIAAKQSIIIGNNVLIASKVFISDLNHGQYSSNSQSDPRTHPNDRPIVSKPIVIEDDVWIGESACVMPGVRIGRGSIIGALAVVTKDIPEYSIAAGNPARVIKKYNFSLNCWERFIS